MQNNVLIANHTIPGINVNGKILKIGNHPPRNSIVIKEHIKIILLYSAKKNNAKLIAEYSTL